ncbi:MAG TPA: hypothetical protein VLD65_08915, partial [Anaerolineales bacterium]|nr:hypothetical protein [Anaerolineales bacterium]
MKLRRYPFRNTSGLLLVDTSRLQHSGEFLRQRVQGCFGIRTAVDILQRGSPLGGSLEEQRLWRELDLHIGCDDLAQRLQV